MEKFPVFLSRHDLIVAAIVTIRNANLHSLSFYNLLSLERQFNFIKNLTKLKHQILDRSCTNLLLMIEDLNLTYKMVILSNFNF